MNLEDALQCRSNELTRLLAGCVGIDAIYTLGLLERLRPQELTDIEARRYIQAMRKKLPELCEENQIDISVDMAWALGLASDFCKWVVGTSNVYEDVPEAIEGLQKLAITRDTLGGMRGWIKEAEAL